MGIEFIECYTPPEDVVTCSVKLDFSELADYSYDGVIFHIAYTELGNNGIKFADRTRFDNFQTEMTLENVVMGSVMYLSSKIPIAPRYDVDTSDFTPIWYERGVFCLVPEAEDLTIQFYYDVNEAVDARPDQVEEGVKFVGAKGVVETGVLPIHEGFLTPDEMRDYDGDDNLYVSCQMDRSLVEGGVTAKIPLSNFGNATAADVRAGVRFTSADGWYEEGEMPTIALPEATIHFDVDSGRILSVVTNNEDGFVEKGETSACTYLRTKKAAVIEPSNTTQIAVQKNYWTTGDVTVAPIPDKYKDATGANALPGQVLEGAYFLGADGVVEEGTIRNARFAGYERKVYLDDDDPTGNTFWVNVSQNYTEGYVERAGRFVAEVYPKLEIDGNKVTMECLGAKIERTVGASINTCNITINIVDNVGVIGVTATQFANGTVTTFGQSKSSGTFTIPNVICGSIITVICYRYFSLDSWTHAVQVANTSLTLIAPNTTGDYSANILEYED